MKRGIYFFILITLVSISLVSAGLFGKTTGKVTSSSLPDIMASGYDGPISIPYDATTYLTWSIPPSSLPPSPIPGILFAGNCWVVSDDGITVVYMPVASYNGVFVVGPLKNPTTYSLSCNGVTRDSVFVNVIQPVQKNNTCIDSDNGNYPDTFGMLTGYYNGSNFFINDSCASNNSVKEGFCWYDMPNTTIITCNNGCSNGVCLVNSTNQTNQTTSNITNQTPKNNTPTNQTSQTCTDSDGGANFYLKGDTTGQMACGNNIVFVTDFCTGNIVHEGMCDYFTCSDGAVHYGAAFTGETCPYGCFDGACINVSNPSCVDGSSNMKEIATGDAAEILGIGVAVLSSSETNLQISAKLNVAGQEIFLSSDGDTSVVISLESGVYTIELMSASNISATIKVTCGSHSSNKNSCSKGSFDSKEINEGDVGTILGIGVSVIEAEETNTFLSVTLNVGGNSFTLTSDNPLGTVYLLGGQPYTVELLSASDTSATIRITCGIKTNTPPTNNQCKQGDSDSKEINGGEPATILGVSITVLDAVETNTALSATLNVASQIITLTDNNPSQVVTVAGQDYTIELLSTTNTSAIIRVTCGNKSPGLWIDIVAFFKRILGIGQT